MQATGFLEQMRRRKPVLVCLFAILSACAPKHQDVASLVIIGVDGMDPGFVERHWDALPTLRHLRDTGGFRRLGTTTPPQSPVAWSTFITGMLPDGHGIYDFVHRDAKTLSLYSSMNRTEPPRLQLPLGPWLVPVTGAKVVPLRHGAPFWQRLADEGVPVTIMRLPANYPPEKAGHALAGMGVPDLTGSFGTFTLYTDDPEEITRTVPGGRIVRVTNETGRLVLPLAGPPNSLRKDQQIEPISLVVDVDATANAARVAIGGSEVIVKQGEWSEWLHAEFPLIPRLVATKGIFRIYGKQFTPRFQLYVSPVNIDPHEPALPISTPEDFSREIARETGPFYTQGIAEDTAALRQGAFTLEEFLSQTRLVFEDERRLLEYSVRRFKGGVLFFYFSVVDQNSHILWRRHEAELLDSYRAVDTAIGEAVRALPSTTFIVMSDHGFTHFDRSFQLNAWLEENGFLALKGPAGENFANVDWSRTQAYGLGLNGLYINENGREPHGIVTRGDRTAVLNRIRAALLAVRDPKTGMRVVTTVATPNSTSSAPDLIVGYSPGYRTSWTAALGDTAGPVFADNHDPWIGDHCVDPSYVPGVVFSNKLLRKNDPEIRDLPVTALEFFGMRPDVRMLGATIF
jgi:predicted AlkP superfamily phosphohydrolase/phosphomutase